MMRKALWGLLLITMLSEVGFAQSGAQHIPDYAIESRFLAGTPAGLNVHRSMRERTRLSLKGRGMGLLL